MSYLLNFSGDFDAGNIIPAFLPYTADKSLHLFHEITQHSLPEKNQGTAIEEKLGLIKEHFDNQRLSLSGDATILNIGIILGYDHWLFTDFGQLSRLPIFKVKYLRERINNLFKKQKNTLKIYFFITGLKSKPYVAIFNHIEKTGYLPESGETPSEAIDFKWMTRSTLVTHNPQEAKNTILLKEDDPITDSMARAIEGFKDKWKKKLEEYFSTLDFRASLLFNNIVTDIDKCFASIKTVNHYNSSKFIKIADDFFLKHFSLKEGLQSNETLVRYYIDDSNAATNLTSRYGFACMVLECLTKDLLSKSPVRYYQISDLTIDKEVMSTYFTKLNLLADNNKIKL
ncbi:MAG: hypothetical protein NTW16_00365, partial [Bacteroidetes bacterium]|nr:hypothetical protein [Bacteroidota bacterium]